MLRMATIRSVFKSTSSGGRAGNRLGGKDKERRKRVEACVSFSVAAVTNYHKLSD